MTISITFYKFLVLILITISISSCKTPESKENSEPVIVDIVDLISDLETIKSVSNKGVVFKYVLGESAEFGENYIVDIECLVSNESGKEIYYLNNSCDGLDYYLITRPNSYKVMPLINCNANWARISRLEPNKSVKFKTQILQLKESDSVEEIGLDFRAVDNFIPFDTLRENQEVVDKIYLPQTEIDNIIWGIKNNLP